MSKLSPLNSMNLVQDGLNFNPNSQKVLLQIAAGKNPVKMQQQLTCKTRAFESIDIDIPVANFKSNKLS